MFHRWNHYAKSGYSKRHSKKTFLVNCLASITYPERIEEWKSGHHVNPSLSVVGLEETISPTYMPEYSQKRNSLEVCVLDGTHLRTNLRATVCRNTVCGIRVEAWEYVARKGTTPLKTVMIELQSDGKVLDQQNDKYQRTMFSEEVGESMLEEKREDGSLTYKREANFCRCVRQWNDADDIPGISALERCRLSLRFRQWLLDGVDFGVFSPFGNYIKVKSRKYQGVFEVKSRVKTWQVRGIQRDSTCYI